MNIQKTMYRGDTHSLQLENSEEFEKIKIMQFRLILNQLKIEFHKSKLIPSQDVKFPNFHFDYTLVSEMTGHREFVKLIRVGSSCGLSGCVRPKPPKCVPLDTINLNNFKAFVNITYNENVEGLQ